MSLRRRQPGRGLVCVVSGKRDRRARCDKRCGRRNVRRFAGCSCVRTGSAPKATATTTLSGDGARGRPTQGARDRRHTMARRSAADRGDTHCSLGADAWPQLRGRDRGARGRRHALRRHARRAQAQPPGTRAARVDGLPAGRRRRLRAAPAGRRASATPCCWSGSAGRSRTSTCPPAERYAILADAAARIWRPAAGHGLPTGAEKAAYLMTFIATTWEETGRPCSERAVEHALACARRRRAAHDDARAVLVHGDVHQWNALQAGDGFKLVDPDGLLAEPEYDLGVIMREDPLEDDLEERLRAARRPHRAATQERSANGATSSASRPACCARGSICSRSAGRCSRSPSASARERGAGGNQRLPELVRQLGRIVRVLHAARHAASRTAPTLAALPASVWASLRAPSTSPASSAATSSTTRAPASATNRSTIALDDRVAQLAEERTGRPAVAADPAARARRRAPSACSGLAR